VEHHEFTVRIRVGLSHYDLAFSYKFFLRDVAWIHSSKMWAKRGDVGTTSPTGRTRRKTLPMQSRHRFALL
jgi:hypothetical protein